MFTFWHALTRHLCLSALLFCLFAFSYRPLPVRSTVQPPSADWGSGIVDAAQPQPNSAASISFLGGLGGSVHTVAISDTLAYIGEGRTLVSLDIHDPAHPLRQNYIPLPEAAVDFQVVGQRLY